MTTDRELLELAAKAAGIGGGWGGELEYHNGLVDLTDYWVLDGEELFFWNPLTDDGDALRLAGALLLSISIDSGYTRVIDQNERVTYEKGNGRVSTRRAIVRAAAEIGRDTP